MRNSIALTCLTVVTATMLTLSGCSSGASTDSSEEGSASETTQALGAGGGGGDALGAFKGADLFFNAKFGGNGRTCGTCHTAGTGTISPEQIRILSIIDPHNPIFRPIDSDDGLGHSYKRLLTNATIRITLNLPPNIRLHDNPTAKTFTVNRSTPTINNSSLFPQLMWDGRQPDLPSQALGAVHDHFQNTVEPTAKQLDFIADFEKTQFSSYAVERFAHGGPAPTLPAGRTASEKRGRAFFDADKPCGVCHDGPLLNISNANNPLSTEPNFNTVFAGYEGGLGFPQPANSPNPVVTWDLDCPTDDGGLFCDVLCPLFGGGTVTNNVCTMGMPDPGEAIADGQPGDFLFFKTPSLWGVTHTAPYFHDNSAASLEDVMSHYDKFFQFLYGFGFTDQNGFTKQEQQDIVSYLRLL